MEALSEAHQILESMVTQLGFEVTIEKEESQEGACLQILTEESGLLIGKHGDRLDDLQYLVNRTLQKKMEDRETLKIKEQVLKLISFKNFLILKNLF